MTSRVAFCAALYKKSRKPSMMADKSKFGRIWRSSVTVNCGCLFQCQNEGILGHFRRVENEAGERVGVAKAPLPDSHRTATPTVTGFLTTEVRNILGVGNGSRS